MGKQLFAQLFDLLVLCINAVLIETVLRRILLCCFVDDDFDLSIQGLKVGYFLRTGLFAVQFLSLFEETSFLDL